MTLYCLLMYTVSGAAPGPKLDSWVGDSLPASLVSHAERFAFQGRLDINAVGWWTRTVLKIGAMMNKDAEGRKDELHGFDYMDKSAIDPLVARIKELTAAVSGTP